MRADCDMFVICYMQCCISVSAVLYCVDLLSREGILMFAIVMCLVLLMCTFFIQEEFIKQKFYKKKNKQNYYKNKINYNIHYLHLS